MNVPSLARRTEAEFAVLARGDALRASLVAAGLVAVAEGLFLVADATWDAPWSLRGLRVAHAAIALLLVAALLALRRRFQRSWGDCVFVLLALPFVPIFWISEMELAARGLPWAPFVGPKLVAVALALLTPARLWVGAALVLVFVVEALVIWEVGGFATSVTAIAVGEPWVTVFFGLLALALLGFRAQSRKAQRAFLRARVQAEALEALARVFLAVRDRANTPLQTLEVGVALLEKRHPDAAGITGRMERALARLRALTGTLAQHTMPEGWSGHDEPLDLERLLDELESWRQRNGTAPSDRVE